MENQELTGEESLALIARMITKARRDYLDTGLSGLLWGSVIPICSLVTFANYWIGQPKLYLVWYLTFAAVIPQIVIAVREGKARKHKSFEEDQVGGIWIAFGIVMFLFGFIFANYKVDVTPAIYLAVYGLPTFAAGYTRGFRPSIYGAIACWGLSIVSLFVGFPYTMLCITAGALLAWFIPGLILRMRYLQAKQKHV